MSFETWRAIGFQDLEQLAHTVLEAISMSESEIFGKLAWLRSWMFWIELRRTDGEDEQLALNCHFYALAAAAVPFYPAQCRSSLMRSNTSKMEKFMDDMSEKVINDFGIAGLFEVARSW